MLFSHCYIVQTFELTNFKVWTVLSTDDIVQTLRTNELKVWTVLSTDDIIIIIVQTFELTN